ncbi:MAG TPA: hypothetical protein VF815_42870 [Myxococcaceae bacterium]|jgi:hypothetical protein
MNQPDDFLSHAEAEIRRGRDAGSPGTLSVLVGLLPSESRAAYGPVLAVFGCPYQPEAIGAGGSPRESERISACRLALLAMYLDTGVPRWSSWMLNEVISGVLSVPGGAADDLLEAVWRMLRDDSIPLTREVARFTRDILGNLLPRHHKGMPVHLRWLLPLPAGLTSAQAYFSFYVLALKPEAFTQEVERAVEGALKGSDFYGEVFPKA